MTQSESLRLYNVCIKFTYIDPMYEHITRVVHRYTRTGVLK